MSKNNDMITVGQILEMEPGDKQNATWINDDFEAVVSDVKPGNGNAPAQAFLTDPHNDSIAIKASFFNRDLDRFDGKICHFSGKGMTRTEYKGTQQVTIGDKATVQVVGSAGASKPQEQATGQAPRSSATASPEASKKIHGETVGMAINRATEIIREHYVTNFEPAQKIKYFGSPDFSRDLWTIASDIVRIARIMEAGKLADTPKHRADPDAKKREEEAAAAKAKAAAEKEEAERKAKEDAERQSANQSSASAEGSDEDVPF